MKDVRGGADMIQGSLTKFAADRFGNPNASLDLNEGWTQLPTGIYFNTPEFSVSLWVYPIRAESSSRIFDFSNGPFADNVLLTLLKPYFDIYYGSTQSLIAMSDQSVTFNQWQFITITFNGTQGNIFLDGILIKNKIIPKLTMATVSRTNCYFGKSAWSGNGNTSAYLDDLRFFNVSLTQSEVIQLMSQNETGLDFIFYSKSIIRQKALMCAFLTFLLFKSLFIFYRLF